MPTIPSGQQSSTFTIATPDTYTLDANTTRTQTAGTGIQATVSSGYTTIDIQGTLNDTASGARAIRANLPSGQLIVGTAGLVQSRNGDAVQAQSATGRFDVNNFGQIIATSTVVQPTVGGTNPGTAYALNFNAVTGAANAPATDFTSGGIITNGSVANTAALIRSDSGDAIRLGSHQTLINYGTINGNGPVNDASSNNSFNASGNTSTAQTYDNSRGVRINQTNAVSNRIDNFGTITGAQHGIDVGAVGATGLVFVNEAGGQIIGRNGSGVGSDTTGASATTVTVTNSGLIRGAYAPTYDRAGYQTIDGDGDGVDIDGGATITNNAGGVIEGTGAGGFDSNGRANNSEGISIGGGSIVNDGTIRGASFGIVVNNDSNADGSRSGIASTSIINGSAGTITGQNGYAIRLENKTGNAAVDNDTLVNAGTITGNGAIPSGTVLRQDGNPDPGTVGTLDGTTYTSAANAGSARFIRGDGSAIQTGEGADTLSNYGTITGNTGRAVNLEGGDDTLNLYTGSTVTGRIDGGAGTDTLNLRLDDRPANAASGPGSLGANSGVTGGTLSEVVNVERLAVQGGNWTIQDAQSYVSGISLAAETGLTIGASGSLAGSGAISFATLSGNATARLTLAQTAQPTSTTFATDIANFGAGSQLDLQGLSDAQVSYNGSTSLLTVTGTSGGGSVTQSYTVTLADGETADGFRAQDDGNGGTLVTVCYASGTGILTVEGDIPVEALRVGDLAVTSSGDHRPIKWIGHRTLACQGRREVLPVRIAANAFAEGRPSRDLFVSPAHAIAVDVLGEALIPACRLINGTTITQVDVESVTYWHVELDSHDILLAENLPAESYLDCGNRRFFSNAEATDLLAAPDIRPDGPLPFCRPFHEAGPLVDLVRGRLQDRAEALGWRKIEEAFAGLHLVADGRTIRPDVEGLTARFVVSADARDVRLVSATSVPAHVLPGSSDDRKLGVPLAALTIDDGLTGARLIALDDARLNDGFHAADDGARWTAGSAVLPAELWAGCKGAFFLRVTLAGPALAHWIAPGETAGVVDLAGRRQA